MCGGGGGYSPPPVVIPEEKKAPEAMKNPEKVAVDDETAKKRGKNALKIDASTSSTGAGLNIPT